MISDLPVEWLQEKGTIADFERAQLERTAAAFNLPIERVIEKFGHRPFGDLTEPLRAFAKQKEESEELWSFSSPFAKKLGCSGFAIVRGGKIRDTFVTLMA